MRRLLHLKIKDFVSETDERKQQRLAERLKDIVEFSPGLFRYVNEREVKPMVKSAIEKFAYNPDPINKLNLLHAIGSMGF